MDFNPRTKDEGESDLLGDKIKKKPSWRFDGISGDFANVTIEFNFFFGIVRRMAVTPLTLFCFGNVSFVEAFELDSL